ncbi:MAG TPA: SRPBCC family protein [Segeticoccus sp.]|uniref:SRPBCC family protein n=1 Tax=Segeticoccus sp. TaxID=2706531 RepID=UPI002D7E1ED9|nr:SRPBCC family protein [Segeticoccus sp.]HET8599723.1 SRPBCC family protein [Segeticoccus sp.]
MSENSNDQTSKPTMGEQVKSSLTELPMDMLKSQLRELKDAAMGRAVGHAKGWVDNATDRLNEVASGERDVGGVLGRSASKAGEEAVEGGSPAKGALKGALSGVKDKVKDAIPGMGGGGGGGGGKATKSTNFVDSIDVGVPVHVAYNQWTQYEDWPDFMKKVETAQQEDDEPKVDMKAQVFWSHRSWQSTIKEQIPDQLIVWRSTGQKGHVDGSVSFHELAPRLTRILVTLEYYPQGFMERTGNIWRAQGRRARLEMKHFRRHVMMNTILAPDEVTGWRGEIHDEEVTKTHDDAVAEQEQQEQEDQEQEGQEQEGQDQEGQEQEGREDEEGRAAQEGQQEEGEGQQEGGEQSEDEANGETDEEDSDLGEEQEKSEETGQQDTTEGDDEGGEEPEPESDGEDELTGEEPPAEEDTDASESDEARE